MAYNRLKTLPNFQFGTPFLSRLKNLITRNKNINKLDKTQITWLNNKKH
ncbi:Uncharacterized protein dnl_19970 [Desulfonema limicola]|uniref:Uncharacterized protein n=1 Tax=Desulfonema limicola TaxID=45656 RepID=A0A975B6H7_9BACT|nr:Uncharacterized protein dnl_19970 [Desulfonema limicola]